MSHDELLPLLMRARQVLERYLLDEQGEVMRDDVAQVCMAIDDALPDKSRVCIKTTAHLERMDEAAA